MRYFRFLKDDFNATHPRAEKCVTRCGRIEKFLFLQRPMFNRSKAPRGAFTLIEILVVIGIIALLSAILFPALAKARENGRKVVCVSNMKSLGTAFSLYAQDYGNRYPFAAQLQKWADGGAWVAGGEGGVPKDYNGTSEFGLANPTTFETIAGHEAYPEKGALFPYSKSAQIYVCPSAKDGNVKKLSYSMNCAVAGIAITRIREADKIVLLVDEGDTINDGYLWATNNSGSTDSLFKGHNGSGNLLFTDGHVKSYPFDRMPIDNTPAGLLTKSKTTIGEERFHDLAFGPKGSNVVQALQDDPTKPAKTNTCSEPLT